MSTSNNPHQDDAETEILLADIAQDGNKIIPSFENVNTDDDEKPLGQPANPIGPVAASATIVNLLLATGPFSYPQGFVRLGPVLSTFLLVISCIMAYITSTFMIEAISVANAEDKNRRRDSMFQEASYKSPIA